MIKNILDKHNQRQSRYFNREDKLRKEIQDCKQIVNDLEKKEQRLKYPHFIEGIIQPIAKEISKRKGLTFEVLGPFGLSCETSIHFTKKNFKGKRNKDFVCDYSLTFRPFDEHDEGYKFKKQWLELVDYSKKTKQYKDGTIGQINGFNYQTVPIPKTIPKLIKVMEAKTS